MYLIGQKLKDIKIMKDFKNGKNKKNLKKILIGIAVN